MVRHWATWFAVERSADAPTAASGSMGAGSSCLWLRCQVLTAATTTAATGAITIKSSTRRMSNPTWPECHHERLRRSTLDPCPTPDRCF
jgi:hypothetical protein